MRHKIENKESGILGLNDDAKQYTRQIVASRMNGNMNADDQTTIVSTCAEPQYPRAKIDYVANQILNDIWGEQGYITGRTLSYIDDDNNDVVLDGSRQTYNLTIAITGKESQSQSNVVKKTVWMAANLTDQRGTKVVNAKLMAAGKEAERAAFFTGTVATALRKAKVVNSTEAFDIVYLPEKEGERSLHSELRVLRELIGRKVIGKAESRSEKLLDFGGSKANCLLCAQQILDGLEHVGFLRKITPKRSLPVGYSKKGSLKPLPKGFRTNARGTSIPFPYHLATTTPMALTMVPVDFYRAYRKKKIVEIIQEHKTKSLANLNKNVEFGGKSQEINAKAINTYFDSLQIDILRGKFSGTVPSATPLESNDGWVVHTGGKRNHRQPGRRNGALTNQHSRKSTPTRGNMIDTDAINEALHKVNEAFPANGELNIANHRKLQRAFICHQRM